MRGVPRHEERDARGERGKRCGREVLVGGAKARLEGLDEHIRLRDLTYHACGSTVGSANGQIKIHLDHRGCVALRGWGG